MSSPSFVPSVWGRTFSRVATRCASPFLLLAGASIILSASSVQAAERAEGRLLVRTSALAPGAVVSPGTITPQSTVRANAVIQSQLRTTLPGATLHENFAQSGWTLVDIPAGMSTDAGLASLKATLGAANVMLDVRLKASVVPNDPQYGTQYWFNKITAPTAWDIARGSDSVVVAVIDSGAQLDHPDLVNNLWRNTQEIANNGRDDDGNGYIDDINGISTVDGETNLPPNDDEGHGTFCAGVIGASTNNGLQVAGVNWNVKVMPLRFIDREGGGYTSGAIKCLEYVMRMKARGVNVRVTSNSWGPDPSDTSGGNSPALRSAFQAAGQAGLLNVCASGNGDINNVAINTDTTPQYPASYDDASIISVAASDENDNPASFSNYGVNSVDLAAPGVRIVGLDIGSSTAIFSGTSMSTPMVAGAAALLLSKEGDLSTSAIKTRILNTVDKLPQWSGKTVTGGRLNLTRMLNNAVNGLPGVSGQAYRLRGSERVPLVGVRITLKLGSKTVGIASTGTDGAYNFPTLAAGKYKMTAVLTGFKFTVQNLTLTASSSQTINFEGVSKKKSYILSGRTVGPDGLPREGIQIFQIGTQGTVLLATTDVNGNYLVYDRPAGTYRLTAQGLGLEWFPEPTAIKLPAKVGAVAPNGIVNFQGFFADVEAPAVSIPAPANNSSVRVGTAPKVSIAASDRSGVDRLYYTLTNTTGGGLSFYNWVTKKWTSNSLETGVRGEKDVDGTPVSLSLTLPKLAAGSYQFQAWGRDNKGNTTLAGNEASINLFAGSSTAATSIQNS